MIDWATHPCQGQVILVTGFGTGIGRATARAFLEQGTTITKEPSP
ncbi:hypothetical protein SBI_09528 [Streptomyces bingchenggensis BCW-1]|uniref:Short-chain dehydrogenase/reductase SDR n=1 Tax=Streptomyces bingchenggensis (strain BCW-1) TaxID=749414 RepID=D7C7U8_STRBB|nr:MULTISPECIES: hypothetical protein [Streptomyces]ADI12646.1 hypothetical protein SBI_09528 [Streptomyces bingchenggensis BCW-1]